MFESDTVKLQIIKFVNLELNNNLSLYKKKKIDIY